MANKKYKLTDGNMWATDGIHDFGQNKTQRTINSEVNTALGGKAPTNHASTSTTYGKGTSSNYGHVKISDSLTDTTPAATGGVVPSMKAVSDLNGAINAITPLDTTPTANSTKGVTSSGVKTAIDNANAVSSNNYITNNSSTVSASSLYLKSVGKLIVISGYATLNGNVSGNGAVLGTFSTVKPASLRKVYGYCTFNNATNFYAFNLNADGTLVTAIGSGTISGQVLFPDGVTFA